MTNEQKIRQLLEYVQAQSPENNLHRAWLEGKADGLRFALSVVAHLEFCDACGGEMPFQGKFMDETTGEEWEQFKCLLCGQIQKNGI